MPAAACEFEPEARAEYIETIRFYAAVTGAAELAPRFVIAIESALATICATPETWRIVEPPDVRRYVLRRFPFVLYYRYESASNSVVVYALMHTSWRPGYWRDRRSDV